MIGLAPEGYWREALLWIVALHDSYSVPVGGCWSQLGPGLQEKNNSIYLFIWEPQAKFASFFWKPFQERGCILLLSNRTFKIIRIFFATQFFFKVQKAEVVHLLIAFIDSISHHIGSKRAQNVSQFPSQGIKEAPEFLVIDWKNFLWFFSIWNQEGTKENFLVIFISVLWASIFVHIYFGNKLKIYARAPTCATPLSRPTWHLSPTVDRISLPFPLSESSQTSLCSHHKNKNRFIQRSSIPIMPLLFVHRIFFVTKGDINAIPYFWGWWGGCLFVWKLGIKGVGSIDSLAVTPVLPFFYLWTIEVIKVKISSIFLCMWVANATRPIFQ